MNSVNAIIPALLLCTLALGAAKAEEGEDPYAEVRAQIQSCEACHGPRGAEPIMPEYPILAGQHMYYTYTQLRDFKAGRRENAIMQPTATALDKEQMKLIAQYFADQQWPTHDRQAKPEDEKPAQRIVNAGQCASCHRGGFEGYSRVPQTRGQNPEYLAKTMLDFKYKRRQNSPSKTSLLATYEDENLESLAVYMGSLPIERIEQSTGSRE